MDDLIERLRTYVSHGAYISDETATSAADTLDRLRRELAEAERLIRRAYGAIGTLRRTSDVAARKSYSDWQDEANVWLKRTPIDAAMAETKEVPK